MRLVPFPCAGKDFLHVGVGGFPAEFGHDLFGRGDKTCRVAGPARGFNDRNVVTRYFAGGLDYLADGESISAADVVDHFIF